MDNHAFETGKIALIFGQLGFIRNVIVVAAQTKYTEPVFTMVISFFFSLRL